MGTGNLFLPLALGSWGEEIEVPVHRQTKLRGSQRQKGGTDCSYCPETQTTTDWTLLRSLLPDITSASDGGNSSEAMRIYHIINSKIQEENSWSLWGKAEREHGGEQRWWQLSRGGDSGAS